MHYFLRAQCFSHRFNAFLRSEMENGEKKNTLKCPLWTSSKVTLSSQLMITYIHLITLVSGVTYCMLQS